MFAGLLISEAWMEKITHRPENYISNNVAKLFLINKNYCINSYVNKI